MADPTSDHSSDHGPGKKGPKHNEHHAHFVEERDDLDAHDAIIVEPEENSHVNVKLGFLQVRHVYQVKFSISDALGKDVYFDSKQNVHAQIESVTPGADGKGHEIVVVFSAVIEKIMQETITISSRDEPSNKVILHLHAKVMGKGKGTPSLKKGIHFLRTV